MTVPFCCRWPGAGLRPVTQREASCQRNFVERVTDVCEQHCTAVIGTHSEQWDQGSSRELVDIALRTVHLRSRSATHRRSMHTRTSTKRG